MIELRMELFKLLRKPRTYIGPVAMLLLIGVSTLGVKYSHQFEYMKRRLSEDFIISGSFVNAAFLCRFLLEGVVYTFLPLFCCMVCGDVLASESAEGTLRTLLCRPITRLNVLASKYAVGIFYVLGLSIGTGVMAYIIGAIFLGRGSLVILTNGVWVFPERMALLRLGIVYSLVAVGMICIGSIAFAVSTFLSNSNGAIAGAMGLMFGSMIIGSIEFFAKIKPFLFTTYLETWRELFADKIDTHMVLKSFGVMLLYSAIAFVIGLWVFHRRDVLS
jgi:ABC-2 type transport system permease protein